MQFFDFLLIFNSIIIGLGLAEVLTGLGQLFRERATVRFSGIHIALVSLIFVGLVQHWWGSWGLRGIETLSFPGFILFVAGPVVLFLLGYLAFPSVVASRDLGAYYREQAPVLWSLVALSLLTTMFFRPLVLGEALATKVTLARGVGVLLCGVLAFSRRRSVHAIGVVLAASLLVAYVFLFALWQGE